MAVIPVQPGHGNDEKVFMEGPRKGKVPQVPVQEKSPRLTLRGRTRVGGGHVGWLRNRGCYAKNR